MEIRRLHVAEGDSGVTGMAMQYADKLVEVLRDSKFHAKYGAGQVEMKQKGGGLVAKVYTFTTLTPTQLWDSGYGDRHNPDAEGAYMRRYEGSKILRITLSQTLDQKGLYKGLESLKQGKIGEVSLEVAFVGGAFTVCRFQL